MLKLRIFGALCVVIGLAGCAHVTNDTNQFYRTQTYLPLPIPSAKTTSSAPLGLPDAPPLAATPDPKTVRGSCRAGPVASFDVTDGDRIYTQVLPGMTLRVIQTSYSATRVEAVPLMTDWSWRVPTSLNCADSMAATPGWDRDGYLHVRHLLSGAQQIKSNPIGPEYFQQAIQAACSGKSATWPDCAQLDIFDLFVRGLVVDTRLQTDTQPLPGSPTGWDPNVPANVRASAQVGTVTTTRGMARWYSGLTKLRWPEDAFLANEQASTCARAFHDPKSKGPNPGTLPQNADVCRFSLQSLEWQQPGPYALPGSSLKDVAQLQLLRSGDPLLLFQPQTHTTPLDLANQQECQGAANCPLAVRTTQGFVQFELSIPVYFEGRRAQAVLAPVGASVADFESLHGLPTGAVTAIRRSEDWLPPKIAIDGKKPTIETHRLAGASRRVTLSFGTSSVASGIRLGDSSDDLILAPGDIIVLGGR